MSLSKVLIAEAIYSPQKYPIDNMAFVVVPNGLYVKNLLIIITLATIIYKNEKIESCSYYNICKKDKPLFIKTDVEEQSFRL